ncbi:MAG: HesA/MoeB/ThiF family protein [Myxococcales bacterium]|nr:HesA/MoeB/ThiF family protein [Myxococcales bacterium]
MPKASAGQRLPHAAHGRLVDTAARGRHRPSVARRILLVGAGGIGAPAAIALAHAGVGALTIVDDDEVELSNLHRQILFDDTDVGRPKLAAFTDALARRWPALEVTAIVGRALPDTALGLCAGASIVIDATDNFATRFLLADAAHLAGVPVVHAAAVRWHATVMGVTAVGRPCYRCLFEDPPIGPAIDCATAGVVGPVCGVAGALAADRALRILAGDTSATGAITTYDGLADRLRQLPIAARADCPLCGASPTIRGVLAERYMPPECDLG